jgi:hypothetical protein
MVLQEGRPALPAATAVADTAHVLLACPLADLDPELEELATDPLGAPQSPPRCHVADEVDRLGWERRRLPRPRSAPPEQAEAGTMPAQNGLRLDDHDRLPPRRQQARADEQLDPIHEVERRALAAPSKDVDLVAQHSVLDDQLPPGADRVHGDAYDLARRLPRGQLRPQPTHARQDPRPDSRDTRRVHPHVGAQSEVADRAPRTP